MLSDNVSLGILLISNLHCCPGEVASEFDLPSSLGLNSRAVMIHEAQESIPRCAISAAIFSNEDNALRPPTQQEVLMGIGTVVGR